MVETVVDAVSRMYFKRSDFRNLDDLHHEIYRQIDILLSNHYAVNTYQSLVDSNVYILEFASLDNEITSVFMLPVWLTAPEAKVIEELRKGNNPLEKKRKASNNNNNNNNFLA